MWNISFCCRVAKITKEGLAPIEMVITVDGQRSFRRLSMKVSPDEFKKLISCKRDNYVKQYCDKDELRTLGLHPFRLHDAIYLPQNEKEDIPFDITQKVYNYINTKRPMLGRCA